MPNLRNHAFGVISSSNTKQRKELISIIPLLLILATWVHCWRWVQCSLVTPPAVKTPAGMQRYPIPTLLIHIYMFICDSPKSNNWARETGPEMFPFLAQRDSVQKKEALNLGLAALLPWTLPPEAELILQSPTTGSLLVRFQTLRGLGFPLPCTIIEASFCSPGDQAPYFFSCACLRVGSWTKWAPNVFYYY